MASHAVRRAALAALAAAWLWLPRGASAQVTSRGGVSARTDITLTGQVTSAIEIEVVGSIDLFNSGTTIITGSGTSGVVNFGTYNIPGPLLTGDKHRSTAGSTKGTYLVATLSISVRLTGGLTAASLDIQRTSPIGPVPDVPDGELLYAIPAPRGNPANRNRKLSWPRWKNFPEQRFGSSVFDVPPSTFVPGFGNLDPAMNSGDFLDHQVAVFIPDSRPPGPFSTVVTYTGTAR